MQKFYAPTIGQRLRNIRKSRGISQSELAKIIGLSAQNTISDIERDKKAPTLDTITKLSKALECDLHWLITGDYSESYKTGIGSLLFCIDNYIEHICSEYNTYREELESLNPEKDHQKIKELKQKINQCLNTENFLRDIYTSFSVITNPHRKYL